MKIQKSAVPTASTSSLNWERSDKKNVHWAQERDNPHRLSQYPQQHQRYQTYLPEHGDEHASGPDDAPMSDGRTIGRIGCTKHPTRAESLRSGRTSNMVAPVGALDDAAIAQRGTCSFIEQMHGTKRMKSPWNIFASTYNSMELPGKIKSHTILQL